MLYTGAKSYQRIQLFAFVFVRCKGKHVYAVLYVSIKLRSQLTGGDVRVIVTQYSKGLVAFG